MRPAPLAILTNAVAGGQRSMLGYGELLVREARASGIDAAVWQPTSALSRVVPQPVRRGMAGKLVRDIERFVLSPLALAGRRADVVHVVDPGNAVYLDVLRYRAAIVTVHDLIPYLCLAGRLEGFRPSRTGRWLMRRILARLARVDRIVCVSEATRRDLLDIADVDPARTRVIPNAVFQPMSPAAAVACIALRRRLGVPEAAPLVLNVGRNFYKNHRTVIATFAAVRRQRSDARLVLVGAPRREVEAVASALGVAEALHLVPFVAREDMAALYTTASVLLFPSLYEGFGYPVLEAQLCGTPVVCSNAGSLQEVAGDGARVFDPDDVAGLSTAVLDLLDDPAARDALVARGQANAQRFTPEAWRRQHMSLYAELGLRPEAELAARRCEGLAA